jgi:CheY-like chemotaxis protein
MNPLRMLIVDDDANLLAILEQSYRRLFAEQGYEPTIDCAATVEAARQLAKAARSNPYDLVSLDVNLGDHALTGLDVLETLKRFRAAWMVVLLTGVETDPTLDRTLGGHRADSLRKELRRDAYAHFPAERLLVVEKPAANTPPEQAQQLMANRLEQIALLYQEIGRLRYVFRPIEVVRLTRLVAPRGTKAKRTFVETTGLHWQVRFNCGEIRTLPDMAGFRTLHYVLSRDVGQSVTPEEALAIEPKNERRGSDVSSQGEDPVATYFEAQGIEWRSLSSDEQEKIIRAALSLKFQRYRELRSYQDSDGLSPAEDDELARIIDELGPLANAAETAYERLAPAEEEAADPNELTAGRMRQEDLHVGGANYDRLGPGRWGQDSPAAQLFRARMKRVRDCLRENGFAEFAEHVERCLTSTGANWSYDRPPGVVWTT